MVVIEGPLGTVLHTGDFRFSNTALIKDIPQQIDFLYMDNTFLTTDENFPTQEEALDQLKVKIHDIGPNPKNKFIIYCYNLGKEEVLVNLAKHFNTKIVVNTDHGDRWSNGNRWMKLEALGIIDYFVKDTTNTS